MLSLISLQLNVELAEAQILYPDFQSPALELILAICQTEAGNQQF